MKRPSSFIALLIVCSISSIYGTTVQVTDSSCQLKVEIYSPDPSAFPLYLPAFDSYDNPSYQGKLFRAKVTPFGNWGGKFRWEVLDGPDDLAIKSAIDQDQIVFEPSLPGRYKLKVSYVVDDCVSSVQSEDIWVYQINLKSLTFDSDPGVLINYSDDWGIGTFNSVYSEPEWVNKSVNNPITHVWDSYVYITLGIRIEPDDINATNLMATIKGEGPLNANGGLSFQWDNQLHGGNQTIGLKSDQKLPDTLQIISGKIDWSIEVDSITTDIGSSGPHEVIVTGDDLKSKDEVEDSLLYPTYKRVRKTIECVSRTIKTNDSLKIADEMWVNCVKPSRYETNSQPENVWKLFDGIPGECKDEAKLEELLIKLTGTPYGDGRVIYLAPTPSGGTPRTGNWTEITNPTDIFHRPSTQNDSLSEKLIYINISRTRTGILISWDQDNWEACFKYTPPGSLITRYYAGATDLPVDKTPSYIIAYVSQFTLYCKYPEGDITAFGNWIIPRTDDKKFVQFECGCPSNVESEKKDWPICGNGLCNVCNMEIPSKIREIFGSPSCP